MSAEPETGVETRRRIYERWPAERDKRLREAGDVFAEVVEAQRQMSEHHPLYGLLDRMGCLLVAHMDVLNVQGNPAPEEPNHGRPR